jgi:hypothetical protein
MVAKLSFLFLVVIMLLPVVTAQIPINRSRPLPPNYAQPTAPLSNQIPVQNLVGKVDTSTMPTVTTTTTTIEKSKLIGLPLESIFYFVMGMIVGAVITTIILMKYFF